MLSLKRNEIKYIIIFILAGTDEKLKKLFRDFEVGDAWIGEISDGFSHIEDEEIKKDIAEGLDLLHNLMKEKSLDQNIVTAAKILKEKGFKVALLTNNGWINEERTKSLVLDDLSLFDVVVESCRVKMRKPNSDIYLHTIEQLGLTPQECVFVDDFDINIEGARKVGMPTVQVVRGDSDAAVQELEKLVGTSLKA